MADRSDMSLADLVEERGEEVVERMCLLSVDLVLVMSGCPEEVKEPNVDV